MTALVHVLPREDLVSAAVVGTGRRPVLADGTPLSETATWHEAHLVAQTRRVAAGVLDRPRPEPHETPSELLEPAPATWAALCRQLLARNRTSLLGAALGDLADNTYRLPVRDVVPVVSALSGPLTRDRAGEAATRTALLSVLGERGRAVVLRNPEWRRALLGDTDATAPAADTAGDPDELWNNGTVSQRAELLRAERRSDPTSSRHRLATLVGKGSAKERSTLLELWEESPEPDDLPVIEQFTGDRSKSVREVAVRILLRLPGSTVRAEREAEAADVLEHAPDDKSRHRLEELVALTDPDEFPKIFGRDVDGVLQTRPALVTSVLSGALAHGRFDTVADLARRIADGTLPAGGYIRVPDLPPDQQSVVMDAFAPESRLGFLDAWPRWSTETALTACADIHHAVEQEKKNSRTLNYSVDRQVIDQMPFRAPAVPEIPARLREIAALPQAEGAFANALHAAALDHTLRSQMLATLR